MYAVIEEGSKQYVVKKDDKILVEKLNLPEKSDYIIQKVLLFNDGNGNVEIGRPYVDSKKVSSIVLQHLKSKKIIVMRKTKSKKNWRKKIGHRQQLTLLQIKDFVSS